MMHGLLGSVLSPRNAPGGNHSNQNGGDPPRPQTTSFPLKPTPPPTFAASRLNSRGSDVRGVSVPQQIAVAGTTSPPMVVHRRVLEQAPPPDLTITNSSSSPVAPNTSSVLLKLTNNIIAGIGAADHSTQRSVGGGPTQRGGGGASDRAGPTQRGGGGGASNGAKNERCGGASGSDAEVPGGPGGGVVLSDRRSSVGASAASSGAGAIKAVDFASSHPNWRPLERKKESEPKVPEPQKDESVLPLSGIPVGPGATGPNDAAGNNNRASNSSADVPSDESPAEEKKPPPGPVLTTLKNGVEEQRAPPDQHVTSPLRLRRKNDVAGVHKLRSTVV